MIKVQIVDNAFSFSQSDTTTKKRHDAISFLSIDGLMIVQDSVLYTCYRDSTRRWETINLNKLYSAQ